MRSIQPKMNDLCRLNREVEHTVGFHGQQGRDVVNLYDGASHSVFRQPFASELAEPKKYGVRIYVALVSIRPLDLLSACCTPPQ